MGFPPIPEGVPKSADKCGEPHFLRKKCTNNAQKVRFSALFGTFRHSLWNRRKPHFLCRLMFLPFGLRGSTGNTQYYPPPPPAKSANSRGLLHEMLLSLAPLQKLVLEIFVSCCGQIVTVPPLQNHFVNIFFVFAWEFCNEKWQGFLVNFLWSPFPTKQSTKNPRKIRGKFGSKIREHNSGRKFEKFGELSFCNFSDLTNWKAANGGANRIVRFLGGKTYHRVRPPKPVLEASESGICLVCAGFL